MSAENQMQTQPITGMMPSQLAVVQLVFNSIVEKPWFPDTEQNREECSVMVLQKYRKDYPEPETLLRECLATARQRYAA